MATETETETETGTVVAHPAVDPVDEKIEKIVDEVKAVEEESSTPCKDIGEDSAKVEEPQQEEEVSQKLEPPAMEIKTEDDVADEENEQIDPIPESQIPEDIKQAKSIEQLIKDSSEEPVDVAAPGFEAVTEEKTSAGLPQELETEETATNYSQEQDDQPITDPQVQGGILEDIPAEKEKDDQPYLESVIKKEEEEPELTSVERELENIPSMEAAIREEEVKQHPDESVLIETEEKPSLVSSETGQEQQPSINLDTKEAEDQLEVGLVEKNPEDQPLAKPTVEEGEDQLEVKPEDQQSLSANSIPPLDVGCEPAMETEQPVLVLPGEDLEPAIVKEETTYSDSGATTIEPEPTITTELEQTVLPGEELEPAIVKKTTATNVESEPATTIEMEQPQPVLPGEESEPAVVKETIYSDSGASNVDSEPATTKEMEQPVSVLPEEELEPAILKETTNSESGAINEENLQQETTRLDDEQTEQLQTTDEVEDAAAETVKDEGLLDVGAENTSMVKDGEVCKEVKEIENSEEERVEQSESAGGDDSTQPIPESIKEEVNESSKEEIFETLPRDVVLTDEKSAEEEAKQSESAGGDDSTPPVPESIKEEVDESSTIENVDKLPKDVVLTNEKSAEEDEETTVETGERNKQEGVIAQEVTTFEDVGGSLPAPNVANSSTDEERGCQEVDLIAENKTDEDVKDVKDVKDENAAVTEPSEVECIEKTVDNLTNVTGDTTEENTERSVELSTEEMADADQISKPNVENEEPSSKEGDESKSSETQEKEVPSKPAQKHSNNILSKVKQSLVKAKKAIIGKSPGSKNVPSETKGDIQVK